MATEHNHIKTLIDKLETLPQDRLDEVEDLDIRGQVLFFAKFKNYIH